MASYSFLLKKRGLPAPSGLAEIQTRGVLRRRKEPLKLQAHDYPGMIKIDDIRKRFEEVAPSTRALSPRAPFEIVTENGRFVRYNDRDVNAVWCGFVLGCRWHAHVAKK